MTFSTSQIRWTLGILAFVAIMAYFVAPDPTGIEPSSDPFVGRWLVNGTDPFAQEYSGTLTITKTEGEFTLDWIITGAIVRGVGQRQGDLLAGTWTRPSTGDDDAGGQSSGTFEYRVDVDDRLIGSVTVGDEVASGEEIGERAR